MEMFINHDSVLGGIEKLETIGRQAIAMVTEASQATLNGSFSGVSGLDQLGGGHGGVINGGAGSAITVLQSYAEQVEWLSGALAASYQALTGQNAFVARGMDIADEGGAVGADGVSFPARPRPRFENFSFTPPVVLPALSIEQLAVDFSATRIAECVAASRLWHSLSAETSAIARSLDGVAQELAGSNRGEVIEAAIERISQVARAGDTFAQNSRVMGSSVERLSAIKQDGALKVNFTRMALAGIVDPVQRTAAEQSFLQSFPAMYMPSVVTGIPPIRNLMVMDPAADGGGEVALGMSDVEGKGSKHDAAGHRAPGAALDALTPPQQAGGGGGGDFGTVRAGVDGLAGVDGAGVLQAGDLGTAAASTGAVPSPTTVGTTGAPAFGPGGVSPAGAGPVLGGPVPMGGFGNAGNALTAAAGAGRAPLSLGGGGPVTGTPGGGTALGASRPGRVGGPGASGIAPRPGAGTPSAAPPGALSRTSSGIHAGGPAGVTPGTPAAAGNAAGAGTRSPGGAPAAGTGAASKSVGTPAGRGMTPMMGAPMMGQAQSKSAKVRAVTSAVEEEDNVAALLGERPPVVPGVIGAWARG